MNKLKFGWFCNFVGIVGKIIFLEALFMDNKIIGVVGAGTMGQGVAQRFAANGFSVILVDIDDDVIKNAEKETIRSLKMQNVFGGKQYDVDAVMSRIVFTLSYDKLSEADFVVENVPEIRELKYEVYGKLSSICKEECIFMVNTSCISITDIGGKTDRDDKVIGVHFMNPVILKNFSEVIAGLKTSAETIESVRHLLSLVGISCEVINDNPGFVSNRLSHIFMNEAVSLVQEGVATAEQIDSIFRNGFGHTMGPLQTADLIGLDVVVNSLEELVDAYHDSKYNPCTLLRRMVSAGMLGRKSGQGFYKYK